MSLPRTGTVPPFKRTDGRVYFRARARIRLADGARERIDVPEKYATPAGGKTARERAELYAAAMQEREDEGGEHGPLLVAKRAREADAATKNDGRHAETWEQWVKRYLPTKECGENHRAKCG